MCLMDAEAILERLTAIQNRLDATTPGHWTAADEHGLMPNADPAWCVCNSDLDDNYMGDIAWMPQGHRQQEANAEFIAHAHQDVPWLIKTLLLLALDASPGTGTTDGGN